MLHETNASSHLLSFLPVVSSGLAVLAHENMIMGGADTA